MNSNTRKAAEKLSEGELTCVLCRGEDLISSSESGVFPLISWIESGKDLRGYSAADKIVGRAAAFMYCLMGVSEVYAQVMSRGAEEVLKSHGISFCGETVTDSIINRKGTGPCPMEQAVSGVNEPELAYKKILEKAAALKGG